MQVVKFARRGNSYSLSIPRRLMGQLRWAPGDAIVLEAEGEELFATALKKHMVRFESRRQKRAHYENPAGAEAAAPDGDSAG